MWSLGCVFLEMCVILADRALRDMRAFFTSNGSKREYVHANPDAFGLWIQELRSAMDDVWADSTLDSPQPPDHQPLDLVRAMCDPNADRRIDSESLVRRIFDFSSPPHYTGQCCRSFKFRASLESHADDTETWDISGITSPHRLEDDTAANEQYPNTDASKSRYVHPFVEDADTTTLVAEPEQFPKDEAGSVPSTSEHEQSASLVSNHMTTPLTEAPVAPLLHPVSRPIQAKSVKTTTSHDKSLSAAQLANKKMAMLPPSNLSCLPCPWPTCKPPPGLATVYFDSPQSLRSHLSQKHAVHEFGWTRLLDESPASQLTPETGRFITVNHKAEDVRIIHGDGTSGRFSRAAAQDGYQSTGGKQGAGNRTSTNMVHPEMPRNIGGKDITRGSMQIPSSCYVPSYVLGQSIAR